MSGAFRFDGRGVWPWLLVALYTLAPFGLMRAHTSDETLFEMVIVMLPITLILGALGPLLIVVFATLAVPVFVGDVPYVGDCRSLGEDSLLYIPLAMALPLACMVTSALFYHLGRSALSPDTRMLGNLVFPLIGALFAWGTLGLMGARMDLALKSGWVCNGG